MSKEQMSFDPDWYMAAYADVVKAGIDPFEHYVSHGKGEGRYPTQAASEEALGFDRAWYLAAYPDVAASGQDPYMHWLAYGKAEGRQTNGKFSFSPEQLAVLAKSYHFKNCAESSSEPAQIDPNSSEPAFDSAQYWRNRYRAGGNSGAGSYGRLAEFKAATINGFVREQGISSLIEFGCGDGAQLELADYPAYVGFDVADESVELCRSKFAQDSTKQFRSATAWSYERAHLALSLDVIYHLVEDDVFHDYMRKLFFSAERYVIVYSSNHDGGHIAAHVRHRKFTEWVGIYHADFSLIRYVPNRWPLVDDGQTQSFADFYIFERQPRRKHTLPGHLVVSLTSYARRFPTLELTLRRILQQSVEPDETVLWVSPEDRRQLPEGVLALQHCGLTVRVSKEIRSYMKIIPTLERYPDSFIVTLDDDTAYPLDTVETLVAAYRTNKEILCRRAHRITFDESGNPKPYTQWEFETPQESGSDFFATGVGGVLYPPNSLASETLNEAAFTLLAPFADDLWLFWMGRLSGSRVRRVGPRYPLQTWPGCHEQGLWANHNEAGGNDPVVVALIARYGSPFKPEFTPVPSASDAASRSVTRLESPTNMPRYRFPLLRRIAQPFTRPALRALANRFMPRAEAVANIRGIEENIQGIEGNIRGVEAGIEEVAQKLGTQLHEVRESLASLERAHAHLEQQERDRFAQVRAEAEASGTTIASLGAHISELERSAAFDRQAIHDLGHQLFSGPHDLALATLGVGVVIATCDRPERLRMALESIAAQTRKPEMVVVVDDGYGSVDEIVRDFTGRLPTLVLRTPAPRSGSSVARNVALDVLHTPLIAFLDDDNLMWARWIERAAAVLESDETLDVIYGAQLRDNDASATDKSWFLIPYDLDRLKKSNFIDLNQLMHRLSDVRFDTQMRRLVDWDYVLKLIDRGPGRIAPVEAISSIYSANAHGRITVPNWPPDLAEVAASRRNEHSIFLPKNSLACPCSYQGEFLPGPNGRPAASCPQCGSLERHRFLRLMVPLLRACWIPSSRSGAALSMLEVAPSDAMKPVRDMFGVAVTVDADPQADGRTVNVIASLTDLPIPPASFDMAVVLHVLEHIPDDSAAMRELARVLRPSGLAVVQVPLSDAATTDEEVLNSPQDRLARYGQADHVRLYGQDFFSRLNAAGLTTASISPRQSMPQESIEKYGLIADEALILAVRSDSDRAKIRLKELVAILEKGRF